MGAGALGKRDGKVRIVLRSQARALLPKPEELSENTSALARALDAELLAKGASFLVALDMQSAPEELGDALTELVWLGRITNDTMAFLRGLKVRPRHPKAKMKARMSAHSGRWSSTQRIAGPDDASGHSLVQRAHARCQAALDCFGVVSRDLGTDIVGAEVGAVLRTLEERGTLRRGLFVEDLQGKQYARTGVVDALREQGPDQLGTVLAACDPASPWGAAFSWPSQGGARRSGAVVLSWNGEPICYLHNGKLTTYCRDERLDSIIASLLPQFANKRTLRLTHIDGVIARHSELAPRFCAHDFEREQKALVLQPWRS